MSNLSRLINEATEIEMAILNISAIKEAVVIAREDIPGDKRLVAYVVSKRDPAPTTSELRHYLQEKLSDDMLPSVFVFLDTLPLTPNGKVDRLALPAPDGSKPEMKATFVAPRNDVERELTQIWEALLGIQPIGVKDNFFDLDGDSLLAVDLFAQIEQKFGKKLPLATLFQSDTIEALAKIIRPQEELTSGNQVLISDKAQDKSKTPWSSLVEIQPNGSKPPLFCMHPMAGELLGYRTLAPHLGADQPVYGLQPQGLDGKQPPSTCLEDMASHYIQEIQTIQRNGPYFLVGYSFGGIVAFEVAQQLHRQREKVGILVMIDTIRPGYEKRVPFLMRVFLHLGNAFQQGPTYLWQKVLSWIAHGKYHLKRRAERSLNVAQHVLDIMDQLPEDDEHLSIIRANEQAQREYIFQDYLGGVTLLRTEDKNRESAEGMQYDRQFGWGNIIAEGIDMHYIPGSHISVLEEPNVRVVGEKMKVCLDKAYAVNLTSVKS